MEIISLNPSPVSGDKIYEIKMIINNKNYNGLLIKQEVQGDKQQ